MIVKKDFLLNLGVEFEKSFIRGIWDENPLKIICNKFGVLGIYDRM